MEGGREVGKEAGRGALKLQEWTMQEWTVTEEVAGAGQ